MLGSGVVSFLLAPGVCAFFAEDDLVLKRRPLLRDIASYSFAVILLVIFFKDGTIDWWESVMLLAVYISYLFIVIFSSKCREAWRVKVQGKAPTRKTSFVKPRPGLGDEVDEELLHENGIEMRPTGAQGEDDDGSDDDDDDEEMSAWLVGVQSRFVRDAKNATHHEHVGRRRV